ncbi:2-oxo-4-hydroxy-4-carboxy-5-ureidoimidazoline decarboxylase [Pseudoruegeria sp. SK021]|uniref:2-oxo-4-hydroxy-4-carboxy-5-ureidoimidazoline decarboxylase n=1 Tax=Pseudoruegeria sp. SK021 TaxID=1933035 RepID=UPI000A224207|nr:2-oxo-4-hydroxy-4-carboxy-5-ureidoimidazoline decarboxylase [Pseudoruegeria sp. SK021]OSP54567.1 OHCU decarboxylase [Pseudoruegeria sp. SK021]
MTPSLQSLNAATRPQAVEMIAPLVERSPWVAELAIDARPFGSDEALAQALVEVILTADAQRRTAMFNVHPELAGAAAAEGRMTQESTFEQGRLGLMSLTAAQAKHLRDLNARYLTRFHHPFIIALHRIPDLDTLFATFERRLAASPIEEHTATLAEITSVIRARAAMSFGAPAHNNSTSPSASPL